MKPLLPNARSRCAPAMRITRSISARPGARSPARATGAGAGCDSSMVSSSAATGWPIAAQSGASSSRARTSASRSAHSAASSRNSASPARRSSGAQRRIAERGPVELAEMGVAAAVFEQQGIAHLVQRRAVLPGRQGAEGRPGDVLKIHPMSFRASRKKAAQHPVHPRRGGRPSLRPACKPLKTYTNRSETQM